MAVEEEAGVLVAGVTCANCGLAPRDDNDWLWWRARSDGLGELHLFCGDCDETEFGSGEILTARAVASGERRVDDPGYAASGLA